MNIIVDINRISINNVFFLDTKRNIIMDGIFTKLVYSNEWFTMNGLYVLFPIEVLSIEKNINKYTLKLNPYHSTNYPYVQEFAKLEYRIIEYYKNINQCNRKISNLLSSQIHSGSMKLYRDSNYENNKKKQYIIKISGVWETQEEVGITYKLIEANEDYI